MSLVYPRIEAVKTHSDWGDKFASNNQHRRSKSQVTPQEENVQGKLGNSTNRVVLNYHKTTLTGQNQTTWLLVSALYYLPLSSAKLFQICPSYIQTCWWIPTPFKFYYTVALNSWLCNWVFPSWPFCFLLPTPNLLSEPTIFNSWCNETRSGWNKQMKGMIQNR